MCYRMDTISIKIYNLIEKEISNNTNMLVMLLLLNKVYFQALVLDKFEKENCIKVIKDISEVSEYRAEWEEIYDYFKMTGAGINFSSIMSKIKNVSSKINDIVTDPDISNAGKKIMKIVKGGNNDDINDFSNSIVLDLDSEKQKYNNKLQEYLAEYAAILKYENIFKSSPEKTKEILYPYYEKIVNNDNFDKVEITPEVKTAYNKLIIDKIFAEIEAKINFYNNNSYYVANGVDRLIKEKKKFE